MIKPNNIKTLNKTLPKDWKLERLGSFLKKIIGGGTPSRNVEEYWNGDIPWATVKDFASFNPNKTQENITIKGLKNSSTNLIPANTLITATRMGLGKASIYNVEVAINQDLKALFPKENLDLKYLYYWFNKNEKFIESLGTGSTVKGITLNDLRSLQFYEVPLPEQKAIADCLSTWDKGIEKLTALIQSKKEQKKGMMQQLLTGEKRLDGYTEEWRKMKFSDFSNVVRGGSPRPINEFITKGDGLNWLRIGDIKEGAKFIFKTEEKIIPEGLSKTRLVKSGELILSNSMSFGRPFILKIDTCIHDGWLAITEISDVVNQQFLYYLISGSYVQSKFQHLAAGSGVRNLNKELVSNLKLYFPSFDEQESIVEILSISDKEIELLEKKLDQFKTQKKGLMQVLLTGEKRLVDNN